MSKQKKKNIIIGVVILIVAIGQFIFFYSVQSRAIWRSSRQFSGSNGFTDTDSFNVPPNLLGGNRYVIQASGYFRYIGDRDWGDITFTHVETHQQFFFAYHIGEGPFIGEDSDSQIWVLPSGLYDITWSSTDSQPNFKLIAISFFYDFDGLVLMVSGIITVLVLIAVIILIVRSVKELSSVKKPSLPQRLDTVELTKGKNPIAPNDSIKLEDYKYCTHCYSMMEKHVKFCMNCGHTFEI